MNNELQRVKAAEIIPYLPAPMQSAEMHSAIERAVQERNVEFLRTVLSLAQQNQQPTRRNSLIGIDVSPTIVVMGNLSVNSHNTSTATSTNNYSSESQASSVFAGWALLCAIIFFLFAVCSAIENRQSDRRNSPSNHHRVEKKNNESFR